MLWLRRAGVLAWLLLTAFGADAMGQTVAPEILISAG
jgi:hypothetical protein